jgi:glycerol-3-phosphate O-acyltransferase
MHPPIFDFNDQRESIVDEVSERVCSAVKDPLLVLNDAAYQEIRRLGRKPEGAEWRALARSIGKMGGDQRKQKLRALARRYAWDVAGNFNPRVYKFASRAMAPLLGALLSPRATLGKLNRVFELSALDGRVVIQGPTSHISKLAEIGTLVFVPTHLSNLDSVVFGFALERSGLPPATYGAGKNLFTNPVLSYFMHNLGAYRVDRRLKHGLYKDVLKTYSCVLIERGYHSLFFPGGTRSRSGGVERKLKLGLAGTGIEAFARTAERAHASGAHSSQKPRKVFFVPATINYLLTLEAETLIDDFLQEEGKARYIIEDDESTQLSRVSAFMRKLLGMDAGCVIRFSKPIDCFGDEVDDEGVSYDARGRVVDPVTHITDLDGRPRRNGARDAQYTRELGDVVCAAYKRDTVVMTTHVVAACAFERIRQSLSGAEGRRPGVKPDLFAMLRHGDDVLVSRADLAADVEALVARARRLEARGQIVLSTGVAKADGRAILDDALRAFFGYHSAPVLEPRGEDLVLADTRLIFYYQNRLAAHGLAADFIAPPGVPAEPPFVDVEAPLPVQGAPAVEYPADRAP